MAAELARAGLDVVGVDERLEHTGATFVRGHATITAPGQVTVDGTTYDGASC